MRSLGAVGFTIHSMIKFPTNQGIVTMETSRETLRECKHLERVQGSWKEVRWRQYEEQMSGIREQVILRARSNSGKRPSSGPVSLEKTRSKEDIEEVFTISHERPDQIKELCCYTSEDDRKGVSRSKRTKRGNTLGGSSNKKKKVKEGNFLGHMVTEEGLKADPERIQEIILSLTPRKAGWTNEAEEALRRIKRKLGKLQTLDIPKEGETLIKEAEGLVMKKFFGQGDQVEGTPDANEGGTCTLSKKLQAKSTPTPRAWRLYLGKETIEEGSGVGIILVSPEEKMHSYVIRLKFNASNHVEGSHTPATEHERKYKEEILDATALFHRFRITHLPKILNPKVEVLTGLATIKLEFLNQEVSVGIKTRPSVEETSSSKKGMATINTPGTKPNCNRHASRSN
ncbi:hypothetical protein Tco_0770024 [Tanacetum coccineum]|uniref:Uncharacterized protein n=1 Tax=Tanacetum coccineum TaxID=301880 RepID=A0ABQ4ZB09_9ASTR